MKKKYKYDAIIVLASYPDIKTWKFPQQVYNCLDKAKQLLEEGAAPVIALSGDRGVMFDNRGIVQPFRECDKMAEYLLEHGVPKSKILREGKSRDTISNLYYLKKQILIPRDMKNIHFVVASFRIPRIKFLCERILGNEYHVTFEPIPAKKDSHYNEEHTWKVHELFLESMRPGDHQWLDGKFYTAWMYQYWKERHKEKYGG